MHDGTSDAARALEEVDAIRRRVVNVVGHALRTPVTTLCGMAETLARTEDAATRAALADGVVRNARIVERLLDQLLIAADVSTALPVGDPVRIDVAGAAGDVWQQLGATRTLGLSGEGTVRARTSAIEQILSLVLDNAHKYGEGDVRVATTSANGSVLIEIETSGPEPSDEEVDQAFELFYRGEHAVMRAAGMGMGLTVARTLAQHEGGDVTLFRRDGVIVTSIRLPS